ncbi:hypothetical protein [Leyella stercorea]|uniref:hypothetical protein n=1 Tax=Leyella stercorea TaxID=363265 RepID=UPI003A902C04
MAPHVRPYCGHLSRRTAQPAQLILPDSLVFSINGKTSFSYPKIETTDKGQYPFGTPYYLLVDMQIQGAWVGKADPKQLPIELEVDWVKFYELEK